MGTGRRRNSAPDWHTESLWFSDIGSDWGVSPETGSDALNFSGFQTWAATGECPQRLVLAQ